MQQYLEEIFYTRRNFVKNAKDAFNKAEHKEINKGLRTPDIVVPKWTVSPCDVYKINQDVTIDKTVKKMGVGVNVRAHEEKVLATICFAKSYIINTTITKTFAV